MAGSVPGRIGRGTKSQDASYSSRSPLRQTTGKPVRLNPVVPPQTLMKQARLGKEKARFGAKRLSGRIRCQQIGRDGES